MTIYDFVFCRIIHFCFPLRNSPCATRKELPSRRKPAEANGSCTTSFRMTLFPLARSVTNCRADGGPPDSSLIKITHCQQTPQKHGRRLRGIQFLPYIQWTEINIRVHSCPFVVPSHLFKLQQLAFHVQSPRITSQTAISSHHSMARNDDGNRIMAYRVSNRSRTCLHPLRFI